MSLISTSQQINDINPEYNLKIEHEKNKDKLKIFFNDFICGSLAGILTGVFVAPFEYLKVVRQIENIPLSRHLKSKEAYVKMMKNIPQFSCILLVAFGLEFSINERIRINYGNLVGVAASAITGSGFLTAADHFILRREKGEITMNAFKNLTKIKFNSIWTGFTPMIGREAIFITSVMHLGPWVGKKLNKSSDESISIKWNSIGRIITGSFLTILSQPFDSLARRMQLNLYNNPNQKSTIFNCLREMQNEYKSSNSRFSHPLFKGSVPRMAVAAFGGVYAGGFYEMFKRMTGYE